MNDATTSLLTEHFSYTPLVRKPLRLLQGARRLSNPPLTVIVAVFD